MKQTHDDPWEDIARRFSAGVESDGRVVRLLDDGVVVDLGDDIEGFVPRSQVPMGDRKELADVLAEGQSMGLRVLECDAVNRRIVLTVTQMPERPVRAAAPEGASAEGTSAEGASGEDASAEGTSAEQPPPGEEAATTPTEAMAAPPAATEGTEPSVAEAESARERDVERPAETPDSAAEVEPRS